MSQDRDELAALADMSQLDEQILARAGEEDLVDRMKKEQEKKTEERVPWTKDLKKHWFSYALLVLSFLLTEMTAFYLGTSPKQITNPDGSSYIEFNTDFGHLVTTLIYMIIFPAVTEVAFGYFRDKFNKRETGNFAQGISSGSGAVTALISIVGTGVSGTYIVISTLGSVGFIEVPPSVQNWIIWIVPSLIAFFGLLVWIYDANSREDKSLRMAEEDDRKAEISDNVRMKEIERIGRRAIRAEAIRVYRDMVARGLLSQREAAEGLEQGLSLVELEKKLRRDLTGDGRIGEAHAPAAPAPQAPTRPALPAIPPIGSSRNKYSLDSILSYWKMSRVEARELLRRYRLFDAQAAYDALGSGGYIPDDLDADSFMALYCELVGVNPPYWGNIATALNPGIIPSSDYEVPKAGTNGATLKN